MGSRPTSTSSVEVVWIGFFDALTDKTVPVGFVMRTDWHLSIHYRSDITELKLPRVFSYTLRNLPKVIIQELCTDFPRVQSEGVHKLLSESVFNGLGSFRCWDSIEDNVEIGDVSSYIDAVRGMIDERFVDYTRGVEEFHASCVRQWTQVPEIQKQPSTPTLAHI